MRASVREFVRTRAPAMFEWQQRLRYGHVYDVLKSFPRLFPNLVRQSRNFGCLSIDLDSPYGFFAILETYLLMLAHCERWGLYPHIRFCGWTYARFPGDPDWFGNYFQLKVPMPPDVAAALARGQVQTSRIANIAELGFRLCYERSLTVTGAHALFDKYVAIRPELLKEADSFAKAHFGGRALGLHYRGTDKRSEASPVPWESAIAAVRQALAADPKLETLFVSTDEPEFVDHIRTLDLGLPIVIYDCQHIYYGGKAAHLQEGDGYLKGKEALLSSLLLARCHTLIKTASFLSGWSKIFNPDVKVILLNKPHAESAYFPDALLWREQTCATG